MSAQERALVTGGGGFVGRYLVERLLEGGAAVRVLGRRRYPELERLGAETVAADIADPGAVDRACAGIDTVYHAAACVEIWHRRDELFRTNVQGTGNVLEAAARRGVGRLVFTSSASVVFGDDDLEGVDERTPYPQRFTSLYPETKAAAERLVLAADGQRGLRTLSLRPHLVWGPRDTHLIPNLIALADRGGLVRVGDGANRMDITYVENLADAHLLAAQALASRADAGGRAYFVSQGEPVVAWSFFGELLERMGRRPPQRSISYRRARLIGIACEAIWPLLRRRTPPPMTRFLAAQMAKSHYFDISAARNVLGYEPRISTEQGIERLLESLGCGGGLP